jgi:non-specific serine/threonine protein kinase
MPPRILLSYRRSDSAAIVGRIYDRLTARYGPGSIFLDIDSIPYATDFREHVRATLEQSDVVLAVIGPGWRGVGEGRSRIMDDDDPVRVEVETALQRRLRVFPILVDGAAMPGERDLPSTLTPFAYLNAASVDSGRDFHHHVDRLIASIDDILTSETESRERALDSPTNNLPAESTSLIGRDETVVELRNIISEHRLLTLTGTGGVGKTRLALRVASSVLRDFQDGVWFVDFAPLSQPALIAGTIAATIGIRGSFEGLAIDRLTHRLKRLKVLLLFDNCEHLVDDIAQVVASILETGTEAKILSTSREPLRVPGEQVYTVQALTIPPPADQHRVTELRTYGATLLFMERALSANREFTLNDEDATAVVDLCRALDGIALAVELAAARTRSLNVREISSRVAQRFSLITGGNRNALPRQQTLRALIDWSYDLLKPSERIVMRRLSIFTGGWTIEAMDRVCVDGQLDANEIFDSLSSLVDKSLVVADPKQRPTRFILLESIRAYASQRLNEAGEADLQAAKHATWIASLAEELNTLPRRRRLEEWRNTLRPEIENVRAAITWALKEGRDPALAARLVSAMTPYWQASGAREEGRRWVERALTLRGRGIDQRLDGNLLLAAGVLGTMRDGLEAALTAEALFRELRDERSVAAASGRAAWSLRLMGRHEEAETSARRSLDSWHAAGMQNTWEYACDLDTYASILDALGRVEEARSAYLEALSILDSTGDEEGAANTRINLAELEAAHNEPERALTMVSAAAEKLRSLGSMSTYAIARLNAAAYQIGLGRCHEAEVGAREVLLLAKNGESDSGPFAVEQLAAVAALSGDFRGAARLLGYVTAWYDKSGYQRGPSEQRTHDLTRATLHKKLQVTELTELLADGRKLSDENALAMALSITTYSGHRK